MTHRFGYTPRPVRRSLAPFVVACCLVGCTSLDPEYDPTGADDASDQFPLPPTDLVTGTTEGSIIGTTGDSAFDPSIEGSEGPSSAEDLGESSTSGSTGDEADGSTGVVEFQPPCVDPVFADDFEDVLDVEWLPWGEENGGQVTTANGALVLSFDSGIEPFGANMRTRFDFAEVTLQIELVAPPEPNTGDELVFRVERSQEVCRTGFRIEGRRLWVETETGGVGPFNFKKAESRFLRMRETAGMTIWETSPNGVGWKEVHAKTSCLPADRQAQILVLSGDEASGSRSIAVDRFFNCSG